MREEIAQSSSRAQQIAGPLLRIRIDRLVREDQKIKDKDGERIESREVEYSDYRLIAPEKLSIDSKLRTEQRWRGIFSARLYHDDAALTAQFRLPNKPRNDETLLRWRIAKVEVVLGLGDNRGIRQLAMNIDGVALDPQSGSKIGWLSEGVHFPVPIGVIDQHVGGEIKLAATLALTGTEKLSWLPVGGETKISVQSDWPHPSFTGNYLPQVRTITDAGFKAQWLVSKLSSKTHHKIAECHVDSTSCDGIEEGAFAVELIDPVDRYSMTDRAIKYALLFLGLVFGAVFFIEVMRQLPVHPLQYGLTGLALAVFFLLLLVLAEHIGFVCAYLAAAIGCIGLISVYMSSVLASRKRGVMFAGLLSGLFGLLYGLLQSEDYALLMGAIALFAALAVVMIATRKLNWYRLGQQAA